MKEPMSPVVDRGSNDFPVEDRWAVADAKSPNVATGALYVIPTLRAAAEPSKSAPTKKAVDRSQFVSKTQAITSPSEAKQTKFPLRKPGSKLFFRASPDEDARMFADAIEGNMGKVHI